MTIKMPGHVLAICLELRQHGFQSYAVGGAIRDRLLGLEPLDWDLITNALPEQVEELFQKTRPTGIRFGTITVIVNDNPVQVTTMRRDGSYSDARRPDEVFFTDLLTEDLSRRDFTINALAFDPFNNKIIDPFAGRRHLKRKLLITVGEPGLRFAEDPLRMLRLLRFQSTLGFRIEKKTRLALQAPLIRRVSLERIQSELDKMLLGQNLAPALQSFYQVGLMQETIPELAGTFGISAGDKHPYDLLGHSIMSAHFVTPDPTLRWAALLHDLGKVHSLRRDHAKISAQIAQEILTRLRYRKQLIWQVTQLVANHMFDIHPHSSDRALRRFLAKFGRDTAFQLVHLRQGDLAGMNHNPRQILEYGQTMEERLNEILARDSALTTKDLTLDGNTLMRKLTISPGPLVGELLAFLLEEVVEDPKLNQVDLLLNLAENYLASKPKNNQ